MLKSLIFSLALALPLGLLAQLPERSLETNIEEVSRWRDSVKACKTNIDLLLVEQAAYEQEK
jgi:hypothetical protein